ncbi:hypothetical protein SGPA1_60279 [Streptomyces misionensis JCM 4497]
MADLSPISRGPDDQALHVPCSPYVLAPHPCRRSGRRCRCPGRAGRRSRERRSVGRLLGRPGEEVLAVRGLQPVRRPLGRQAQRPGLRRADRHRRRRRARWHRGQGRSQRCRRRPRVRQRHRDQARERRLLPVRAPVPRGRAHRPDREGRPAHRPVRLHRQLHRPAPALRDPYHPELRLRPQPAVLPARQGPQGLSGR